MSRRRYTLSNLILDIFLTACTGGLWLIVVAVKAARR